MPNGRLLVGQTLAGFRIEEELGAGGMGTVYRGWDAKLQRSVALKVIAATEDASARARLLREAQAACSLDHPNLATVHSVAEEPTGELCIVMRYYEGETLARRLKRGPLRISEAADIAAQVSAGLAEAHRKGITHRDIKPSNLLITPAGVVKILDFGIASIETEQTRLTEPQTVMGTAAYMSPEQMRGEPAGGSSDIWSLAVVVFEMLTARPPFDGSTRYALMQAVLHNEVPVSPLIPAEIATVIWKALAKNPADRYPSVEALSTALEHAVMASGGMLGDKTERLAPTPPREMESPARGDAPQNASKRRLRVAAVILVMLCLAGTVMVVRHVTPDSIAPGSRRAHVTLAILPFSTPPEQSELRELAEGLAESVARRISRVEYVRDRLAVAASSELIARGATDPAEARKRFGANLLASGTLTGDGEERLRLDLEISAPDPGERTTVRVHGTKSTLVQMEQRAADEIANLLAVRMDRQIVKTGQQREVNADAYRNYLSALGYLQRWDKSENLSRSLAGFREATRLDPRLAVAWVGLAEAARTRYAQDKDPSNLQHALAYAQQALQIEKDLPSAHVVLGRVYGETGERDLAVLEFKRALESDPGDLGAIAGMARTYEQLRRTDEAETTLKTGVALHPYSWTAHNHLANFYYRTGRYQEAERVFRRCLDLTPDNAAMHSNLGGVLLALGKLPDAEAAFLRSLKLRPTYQAHTNLGNVFYRERKFAAAAEAYEKALQLVNHDFRIWGSKAQALRKISGRDAEALEAYRRAITLAEESMQTVPADSQSRSLLAIYHAALGDAAAAQRLAAEALANPGTNNDVLINAATAYSLLGQQDHAVRWVEEALRRGYPWRDLVNDPDLRDLLASGRIHRPADSLREK